jgi:hypothetical protein
MKNSKSKSQIPNKFQKPNSKGVLGGEMPSFGIESSEFIWDLGFGFWNFRQRFAIILLLLSALPAFAQPAPRWWKGNLHTHTLWSDGDDYPEMVVDWYKARGYDFLALSDHNVLQDDGNIGVVVTNGTPGFKALPKYLRRFGSNWVHRATDGNGTPMVRLKTLQEFRGLFEAPNRFLLIPAEEITDKFGRWPIHLIAANIQTFVEPRGGNSPIEVMQNNIDAVLQQRERTGVPMMVHLAHPNFYWAVTAEDMIQLRSERFFEVYNGHPLVNNVGDREHASTERMWDIVNTHRIAEKRDLPLLGLAVDDSHHYHQFASTNSNSGRGWVVVRAPELKADSIITALEAGEFYASSGVELSDVVWKDNRLIVRVAPQPGVSYLTQFIGTRRPVDWTHKPVISTNGYQLATTRIYSTNMGSVLSEQRGTSVSYSCKGDELYVRAKVISSKAKENGLAPDEKEMAWTQPVQPVSPQK